MPTWRYTVPGVPPALACTAFTPLFDYRAGSGHQSYKYAVDGQPGTRAVPAPRFATSRQDDPTAQAMMGSARSTDAPPVWYPQQYFQHFIAERPGAGMPIRVYDPVHPGPTTVLPVPAVSERTERLAKSARLSVPRGRRGQRQIRSVPRLPKWPGRGDG